MSEEAFKIHISREYPDLFAFDEKTSLDVTKRFEPKAHYQVKKHFMEGGAKLAAYELARIFAYFNKETKAERLERVRRELNSYWVKIGLLPDTAAQVA